MRKAFTLVEMLMLIVVAPVVLVVISGVFATFIRDLPRETRVVQQHTTVLDMLRQIRRDADQAVALPVQFDGMHADDRTLLIEQPDSVICYQFETGQAMRTLLKGPDGGDADERRTWRVPDAVVTCRLWTRESAAYAVELHSHVRQWASTTQRERLAGDYVFFLHGLAKMREVQ